jgi:hypothetical protein
MLKSWSIAGVAARPFGLAFGLCVGSICVSGLALSANAVEPVSHALKASESLVDAGTGSDAADKTKPSDGKPSDGKPSDGKADEAKPSGAASAQSSVSLPDAQQRLAEQYRELERVLMVMRDLTRQNDPNRAALIEKALKESGDRQVDDELVKIVAALKTDKLATAMEHQGKVDGDLQAVLELLLTEAHPKSADPAKRYKEYLKTINELLIKQKELLNANSTGGDMKMLSAEQGALADKTGKLSGDIRKNEEKPSDGTKPSDNKKGDVDKKGDPGKKSGDKGSADQTQPGDGDKKGDDGKNADKSPGKKGYKGDSNAKKPDAGKPGDGKPSDGKPSDGKSSDGKSSDGKSSDGKSSDGKPSDGKPSDGKPVDGKPSEGKPSDGQQSQGKPSPGQGQPSQGQPSEGQPSDNPPQDQPQQAQQDENPARKRLDAAQQHMKDAQSNLEKAKRDGSMDDQKKAIDQLNIAKAELEEILRQLREEEMKRLLAQLEARFLKILAMQREVYDNTIRLAKVDAQERSHGFDIECGKQSSKETDIIVQTNGALSLLREEGSSVAFPEAVEQVREDMEQVMQRLARGKVGVWPSGPKSPNVTIETEESIIKDLEKIVDALKKAQKDQKNKKQPPGPSQNGQPQDPPLIEMLSELKMIRAMQERINDRTNRYSLSIDGEQAEKEDMLDALQRLGVQQERVYRVTRDLELGKNQ